VIALIPVREGVLPPGADEAAAECGGNALLIGSGTAAAAAQLRLPAAVSGQVRFAETGAYAPGAWARALAPLLAADDIVVLPGSADGRDLAPRLAAEMGRPLWAGAVAVTPSRVTVARYGGQALVEAAIEGPVVTTLLPGVAGVEPVPPGTNAGKARPVELALPPCHDAEVIELVPPTAATIDLTEAPRVFAGGAGLRGTPAPGSAPGPRGTPAPGSAPGPRGTPAPGSAPGPRGTPAPGSAPGPRGTPGPGSTGTASTGTASSSAEFDLLSDVAARAGASLGATRVAVDAGWAPAGRQIGTTGVTISPKLYVAFGVSGAVQHIAGIGAPEHVISVNIDPSCPMMAVADLAVVADAAAVLHELARLLGVPAVNTMERADG
jgi:electron transfer flavoprotein alpha subunit